MDLKKILHEDLDLNLKRFARKFQGIKYNEFWHKIQGFRQDAAFRNSIAQALKDQEKTIQEVRARIEKDNANG